ncbi:GAF domain-containing protein [Gaiella occulta]|uniref:GAF domain-containing protein n=1 Tax=Gaiella occulta TaxID=1002870 RepID=A0A7M2Z106_9ACTN|nr:GAF domain-containing protein [Gaiella occulta]RDI76106.1 GAF domain-containing protein [Gaiella occulta]
MKRAAADMDTVLTRIISTVASSIELDEVLRAVVRLLSDASAVHACFVYLLDDGGEQLVLRAAGEPYEHLIGRIVLERGKGLAWWAAQHNEPAFIPDNLLDDPRVEYVPELEEERFQSLLSVPIAARDGTVIGVISAHTEAPREFTQGEVEFLVTSASLVAGAIENARLYEEMRTRVRELEAIADLAEAIAGARSLDELVPEVASRAVDLLAASACHVYLLEPGGEDLTLHASAPARAPARATLRLAELGSELARGGRASQVAVPLVAGDELLGLLVAEASAAADLARAVASQTAVGIKKIQLIERLTEKNLIKDFFEDLAAGRVGADVEGRAARLGCDFDLPYIVLAADPADEALEPALAALLPGSLFDRRGTTLRGLLRVPAAGPERVAASVRRVHAAQTAPVAIGLSSPCTGIGTFREGFEEARQALLGSTVLKREASVLGFDDLGAYKYILRIALEGGIRDATIEAVSRLADYDRQRSASLLRTLEEFLHRRGNISATSEALYVHPNTLRQRLRRIGELSGIDLRRDDWLMVEIAVKLVRLQLALGASDTPPS